MIKKNYYICISPFFPSPDSWRGAYVLDQVKAIQRNSDYEVAVFVGSRKDESDYEIDGVTVHRYRTRELPSNVLNGVFNDYNSSSFIRKLLKIGIDPMDVAFVHCHVSMRAACGLALKKLNPRIKVLLQHHDLDPFNLRSGVIGRNNRLNIRFRAKKAVKLYEQVDLHVCISEACRDSLKSFPSPRKVEIYDDYIRSLNLCEGLPSAHLKDSYILYNGVDTSLFSSTIHCNSFSNPLTTIQPDKSVFRIGCIGNFQELKDHITLIKAFEILIKKGYINLRLSLLGTGETRQMCEQYIVDHNIATYVEWPKEISHEKLPEYYRSLDLFVLPSYFEGFGCVYTEAAACGIPFMGCKNQGYSEYLLNEEANSWLIEPKDHNSLAKIIENQICLPQIQKYCYTYDIDILIREFLKYIETMIPVKKLDSV